MNDIFEFEGNIINFNNVEFIKTVDTYDCVYMTIGMIHVPVKFRIKDNFISWASDISEEWDDEDIF